MIFITRGYNNVAPSPIELSTFFETFEVECYKTTLNPVNYRINLLSKFKPYSRNKPFYMVEFNIVNNAGTDNYIVKVDTTTDYYHCQTFNIGSLDPEPTFTGKITIDNKYSFEFNIALDVQDITGINNADIFENLVSEE